MRSTILTRCANGPADKGVIPVRPTLQTEIKLFGRHKGGAMKIGACARRTKTLRAPQASAGVQRQVRRRIFPLPD
jgi:hypothetical protein